MAIRRVVLGNGREDTDAGWGEPERKRVVSAGVAAIMASVSDTMGWLTALAVFPVMYAIHRSYRLYFANAAEAPRLASLSRVARAGA